MIEYVASFGAGRELGGERNDGLFGCFDDVAICHMDGGPSAGEVYVEAMGLSSRVEVMAGGAGVDNGCVIGEVVLGGD
jgi:hypothetical protein